MNKINNDLLDVINVSGYLASDKEVKALRKAYEILLKISG